MVDFAVVAAGWANRLIQVEVANGQEPLFDS